MMIICVSSRLLASPNSIRNRVTPGAVVRIVDQPLARCSDLRRYGIVAGIVAVYRNICISLLRTLHRR
jgi:hypothetical protein